MAMATMLVGAGCTTVNVKTPVAGNTPPIDKNALEELNGKWSGDGFLMATRVKDADKGILEVVFLIQESDEIRVERTDAYIRETPAGFVASYKENGQDYRFVRFALEKNWIAVFLPEPDVIRDALRAGALKGAIIRDGGGKETKDLLLDQIGPEDFARAKTAGFPPASLFKGDPSVIMTRVSPGFEK
jgi:hypothetical protein